MQDLEKSDPTPIWLCNCCNKQYVSRYGLCKHMRKCHPDEPLPGALRRSRISKLEDFEKSGLSCEYCRKCFLHSRNLRRHVRIVHPDKSLPDDRRSLRYVKKDPQKIDLKFSNMEEFNKWKLEEEDRTSTCYVKMSKVRRKSTTTASLYQTFRCHRSGFYRPSGLGSRHPKAQGSAKIGGLCPASIHIKIYSDGKVVGWFSSQHVPHKNDMAHRRLLTKQHRQQIAPLLAAGLPVSDVLAQVRGWGGSNKLSPFHRIKRKDIHNISRDFHNLSKRLPTNEAESDWNEAPADSELPMLGAAKDIVEDEISTGEEQVEETKAILKPISMQTQEELIATYRTHMAFLDAAGKEDEAIAREITSAVSKLVAYIIVLKSKRRIAPCSSSKEKTQSKEQKINFCNGGSSLQPSPKRASKQSQIKPKIT